MSVSAGLAILATLFFALGNVASKRGVQSVSPVGGLLLSLPAGLAVAGVGVALSGRVSMQWSAVALFALVGLLTPGLARLMGFRGIQRLDASVHVPIQSSAHPVTAIVISYLLFREELGLVRLLGIAGILVGVWVVSRHTGAAVTIPEYARGNAGGATPRATTAAIAFPVATGVCYGLADVIRRQGMQLMDAAAFGTLVSVATALLAWLALIAVSPAFRSGIHFGAHGKPWFALHGVFNGLAILCVFAALGHGDVSVVSPIIASQPFVVMVLAHIALRDLERVTASKILGSFFIVAGTVAIVTTAS